MDICSKRQQLAKGVGRSFASLCDAHLLIIRTTHHKLNTCGVIIISHENKSQRVCVYRVDFLISYSSIVLMIRLLQLECISNHTVFSLQTAAILLINEIHKITFLVVNGITYTLLMESTINFVLVGSII